VGESVELWSASQNAWVPAVVVAVKPDGTLTAQYGQHQKEIARVHYEGYLRPAAKRPEAAPARRYQEGDAVDVFSTSEGKWVPAKVTSVADNGTVSVKYGRAQKEIQPPFFEEYLRPSAPNGIEVAQDNQTNSFEQFVSPSTMVANVPSSCPYTWGQSVEVWTSSGGGWIEARVQDVAADGTVTVKWGMNMKKIQPHDYAGYLRPMPVANVITEHALPSPAPLPPTFPGNSMGSGVLAGGSGSFPSAGAFGGAIPPTIPGGYAGHGGRLDSSPTMVAADQSGINYQAPPTAFPQSALACAPTALGGAGGSLPPTALGGSPVGIMTQGSLPPTQIGGPGVPVGSGGLRYHDIPPTIPGGYA
jgi:hypothetical protein